MERRAFACLVLAAVLTTGLVCTGAQARDKAVSDLPPPATAATSGTPSASVLLARADRMSSSDHGQFLDILKQLHENESRLTPTQHWHLVFLDAVHWVNAAKGAKATPLLQKVMDHSGNRSLSARATALMIHVDFLNRRYEPAYKLAAGLIAKLPDITDPVARVSVLNEVVQMMNSVGQYDLALKYARQIHATPASDKGRCWRDLEVTETLLYAHRLSSASPKFRTTIDTCLAAKQVTSANALRLDLASLLIDEGHMDQAIALLHKIAPSIRKSRYKFHMASLPVTLAQAYVKQGKDAAARKSALAALAMFDPGSTNWIVQAADKVLYQVAKHAGHDAAALAYYEKYVAHDKASADDNETRALAYQRVKQEVLAKKMRVDALSRKNQVLQLRQKLSDKAVETSRLYVVLMLVVLGLIALWLLRLKHSQLRFRRQARHDGLTGVFNRQHFLHAAEHTLGKLHHSGASVCLLMMDLDHFKRVNDSYGHAAGDEVLKRAVATCRQELRSADVFGRLGGEEFGILIPACSPRQGREIADRIRTTLAAMQVELAPERVVSVSASFGLACSDHSGHDLSRLFSDADAALYRAKKGGRNRVVSACDEAPAERDDGADKASNMRGIAPLLPDQTV